MTKLATTPRKSRESYTPLEVDRIITGNCIEELEKLPENSVDLIFADPPYNLQLQRDLHRPNLTLVDRVDDKWDQFSGFEEYDSFTQRWLKACYRVLKETGTIWVIGSYHNIYRVGRILMDTGFWILNDIVWAKTNPMPNFRGVRFTNATETLIWAQKNKGAKYTFNYHTMKELNGGTQMRSVWELPICSGNERIKINGDKAHSTQKPELLLERVILSNSNVGDLIVDPFFGSGTTGAVAKRLGRCWLGIEQDPTYVDIAQTRIDNVVPAFNLENADQIKKATQFRVSISQLLEFGLMTAGQKLYLKGTGSEAEVLPSGTIRSGDIQGSIHQVGSEIYGMRCNGWDHWEYTSPNSGKRIAIDFLRNNARELILSRDAELKENGNEEK